MPQIRKHAYLRKAADITVSTTLAFSLLGGLAACKTTSNAEEEYEEVTTFDKGVRSYVDEVKPGDFKISAEIAVPTDSSKAIVKYLSGKQDTLAPLAVMGIIDNALKAEPDQVGKVPSLSNALLYGGMGYLLAETNRPNYSDFRPDKQAVAKQDTTYRHRSGGGFMTNMMLFYMTRQAFSRSSGIHTDMGNSARTYTRPVGGQSGFFSKTTRSSFRS
jgi:hypothetical protein